MEVIRIPDPTLRRIKRHHGTLQQQVYAELRRCLMVGAFIPGQAVTLRTLANRLGTSPMPIREAINRLIAERALEIFPNRSVVVPRMAREKFVELSFLRQKFEGIAAEEACRRSKPILLKKLDRLNAELLNAVEKRNVSNVLALNQQFHFAIYEASKYRILVPMIESLWLQAGPFMHFSMSAPGVQWNTSDHKDAIAAIAAGDAVASREAIENDIRRTADYLLKNMAFES